MSWLALVMKYLPSVISAVVAIENSVKTSGTNKKAIVMNAIVAGANVGETVDEQHVSVISGLIDSVVGTLNSTGVFSSTKPKS